jgi:putative zinc finger/helix-turn-helix YgiT family protein
MNERLRCSECGKAFLEPRLTTVEGERYGEKVEVRADALVCPKCGLKTIDAKHLGEFTLLVSDAYRSKHGLFTSTDIKDRRLNMKMSQEQFAIYLGVGIASVKRWELGHIQEAAMNELIRLKTDLSAAKNNAIEVSSRLHMPSFASPDWERFMGACPFSWNAIQQPKVFWELKDNPNINPYKCSQFNFTVGYWNPQTSPPQPEATEPPETELTATHGSIQIPLDLAA